MGQSQRRRCPPQELIKGGVAYRKPYKEILISLLVDPRKGLKAEGSQLVEEAVEGVLRVAQREGLLIGLSSGAVVAAYSTSSRRSWLETSR